ncbi:GntR family transcriptional regulator [uncultured Alsobacter sp.]|uniref:GntR family transcriptional regulator n=1 Tax=uncultured Alsobacter sp. TaxID=1748258 RepID=UPI0025D2B981|nr:GntR family transcriptional regulator [uncultured Alsobacter sp.]
MTIPSSSAPRVASLVHRTKSDLAYAYIRERIFTGELAPGQKLTLALLAELTGMSHMPIREATLRLEGEGLIHSTPHKEMRVAPLSRHDAQEVFQIRGALEGLSASLACARTDAALLDRLRATNGEFAAAQRVADHWEMGEANWRFHRLILDAAGSGQLANLLEGVWAKCRRFRLGYRLIPGRAAATVKEHDAVIAAFERGDEDAARTSMADHVARASHDLLSMLAADEEAEAAAGANP